MSDQPVATARTRWHPWQLLVVAAMIAGLAVVLFATSAFSSSSGSQGPAGGGTPAYQQIQQAPGEHAKGRDCPGRSGQDRPSDPGNASAENI